MSSLRTPCLVGIVIALAAALALSGFPAYVLVSPARPAPAAKTPALPPSPVLDVYGMAMAAADVLAPDAPLAVRQAAAAELAGMSPEAIVSAGRVHAEQSAGDYFGVFLLGCAVGGIAGGLATGGVGAGVGCVAAGIVALIAYQFGLSQAAAANQAQALAWLRSMNVEAGNEFNLTASAVGNELQALMLAQNSFSYEASNAALLQLGSSSFNVFRVMDDSGVAAQLETFYSAEAVTLGRILQGIANWTYGSFGPTGQFSGQGSTYVYDPDSPGTFGYVGTNRGLFYVGYPWMLASSTTESPYLYIAHGSLIETTHTARQGQICTSGYTSNATSLASGVVYTIGSTLRTWTAPSGVYVIGQLPNSYCVIFGTGMIGVASPSYPSVALPGVLSAANTVVTLSGSPFCYSVNSFCTYDGMIGQGILPTSGWSRWNASLSSLMTSAGSVANSYWSFLKSLGYSSASQVPENCVIPMPYQALPPNLNLGNLNQGQLTSLYYAWLQGLGNFFNVTLSSTNFCGQRPGHFSLGDNVTWNVNNVAVGNLYLPSKAAQETYSNPSTWAVAGRQLILMPTLHSIRVPVGTVYPVPAINPIGVYVLNVSLSTGVQIGFPTWYQLVGNGTQTLSTMSVGGPPSAQATTGAAIYLTSCTVNGVPQTICSVSIETLNNTAANLTTPYVPPGGGGMWGIPNPFQVLGDAICKLLGPFCPSGGGAWAAAALEVIFAIGVVVVLVLVVSSVRNRRSKGGSSGVTVNLRR